MIGRMTEPLNRDLLALAQRLALDACDMTRSHHGPVATRRKADTSVVTEMDTAIQDHILSTIAQTYPDHAVRAEETVEKPTAHADPATARYCWVIDPLDGTRNYASGFPFFGTAIAVLDNGRPVVGVFHEHNTKAMYSATSGGGAMLNDRAAHPCEVAAGDDLLLGIPSSKDSLTLGVIRRWTSTRGFICRNVGSTAAHLGMVASGALSGAFAKQCKLWDIAAGWLLIKESGGIITDPRGGELVPFSLTGDPNADVPYLAACPDIHRRLLDTIPNSAS